MKIRRNKTIKSLKKISIKVPNTDDKKVSGFSKVSTKIRRLKKSEIKRLQKNNKLFRVKKKMRLIKYMVFTKTQKPILHKRRKNIYEKGKSLAMVHDIFGLPRVNNIYMNFPPVLQ